MSLDVPSFELDVRTENGRTHLVPRGELDLATAPQLEDRVMSAVREPGGVVLDLRELTFMDSTGIRTIVAAHQAAKQSGTELRVVRPAPDTAVARVIEISGIDEALGLVDAP
ncbi:MAG TPA: STAS domain-containing protein [Solirubrobacteraceae bacterium]|jgi:anti-anti-sigma factor|nr:STAS domain-containing protein [Solirubrobacteraceae bacterium]